MSAAAIGLAVPHMELVTVTPALAAEWLKTNTHNRNMNEKLAAKYAADMEGGRWRHPTGETIIFDSLGRLQQGQHRLRGICLSGVSISFWVLFGADPDDFSVLDSGSKRSSAQVLGIAGMRNSVLAAALCRQYLLFHTVRDKAWTGTMGPTSTEVTKFALEHRDLVEHATDLAREGAAARLPRAAMGAVTLIIMRTSPTVEQFMEFHEQCVSGEMLASDSPAFLLRRWSLAPSVITGGQRQQVEFGVVTKAWNAHVMDKPLKFLRWRRDELPMQSPLPSTY